MLFRFLLDHSEPFALNLDAKPLRVSVRTQVILGFVALGLGKGGLFVSTFLAAMAWSEDGWLTYAITCSVVTLAVMIWGYLITFARIVGLIDLEAGTVHLTKRAPFYRRTTTAALTDYNGIALTSHKDRDQRPIHTLVLAHKDDDALNLPLWRRRGPEPPMHEWMTYTKSLRVERLPKNTQ